MQFIKMSSVFLACLLLVATLAGAQAKEKQIKLEDIERDNLAAERHTKSTKPQTNQGHQGLQAPQSFSSYQQLPHVGYQALGEQNNYYRQPQNVHNQLQHSQGTPSTPRMHYGFIPVKEPQQYYQQQVQQHSSQDLQYQYVTPQTQPHTQAYLPTSRPPLQVAPQRSAHFKSPGVQYAPHKPQQQLPSHRYTIPVGVPVQTQQYQQYLQSQTHQQPISAGSSVSTTGSNSGHSGDVQYIPESQLQQYYQYYQQPQTHSQTQSHQQIQYVVDNSIQHDSQLQSQDPQKYYQQFVYLQPYQTSSASSNIHSVSDTKGNIQYVMYIPAGATTGAATYPPGTVLAYPSNGETQYVYQPVAEDPHAAKPSAEVPITQSHPQISLSDNSQYVYSQETSSKDLPPQRVERPVFKHQPTSLLDSYVPSYLQYQYYKQQQVDNANAIKQSIKVGSTDIGKSDAVKSYKVDGASF